MSQRVHATEFADHSILSCKFSGKQKLLTNTCETERSQKKALECADQKSHDTYPSDDSKQTYDRGPEIGYVIVVVIYAGISASQFSQSAG